MGAIGLLLAATLAVAAGGVSFERLDKITASKCTPTWGRVAFDEITTAEESVHRAKIVNYRGWSAASLFTLTATPLPSSLHERFANDLMMFPAAVNKSFSSNSAVFEILGPSATIIINGKRGHYSCGATCTFLYIEMKKISVAEIIVVVNGREINERYPAKALNQASVISEYSIRPIDAHLLTLRRSDTSVAELELFANHSEVCLNYAFVSNGLKYVRATLNGHTYILENSQPLAWKTARLGLRTGSNVIKLSGGARRGRGDLGVDFTVMTEIFVCPTDPVYTRDTVHGCFSRPLMDRPSESCRVCSCGPRCFVCQEDFCICGDGEHRDDCTSTGAPSKPIVTMPPMTPTNTAVTVSTSDATPPPATDGIGVSPPFELPQSDPPARSEIIIFMVGGVCVAVVVIVGVSLAVFWSRRRGSGYAPVARPTAQDEEEGLRGVRMSMRRLTLSDPVQSPAEPAQQIPETDSLHVSQSADNESGLYENMISPPDVFYSPGGLESPAAVFRSPILSPAPPRISERPLPLPPKTRNSPQRVASAPPAFTVSKKWVRASTSAASTSEASGNYAAPQSLEMATTSSTAAVSSNHQSTSAEVAPSTSGPLPQETAAGNIPLPPDGPVEPVEKRGGSKRGRKRHQSATASTTPCKDAESAKSVQTGNRRKRLKSTTCTTPPPDKRDSTTSTTPPPSKQGPTVESLRRSVRVANAITPGRQNALTPKKLF